MPKDFPRARRIADQIQRELPELIRQEVKDPRVGMLTITEVDVNRDMEFAKVYFTTLGGETEHAACLQGLQRASGFLRSQLSHRMQLRVVPKLTFVYDRSVEHGMALTQLIETAIAEDARHPQEDPPATPTKDA
ncbi:MAG: ribosome-binding factor A [Hydrogenophilales bacterium 16-64-46]|nr:MAG: ribosome-binding factor A [Hydrogenophilales bacterium 12-64-13]OYZ05505.1 MAG: ribosome-binding factor A [Hydrogenophilales bacterium 16-64-46]OZA40085.1 MAG: ribosome-binding factor A [Hydrogenophilales bacterium 17-64-34]HQT00955.1 30S ribosome-binding factor RbfA [Thiobacillus sp.]